MAVWIFKSWPPSLTILVAHTKEKTQHQVHQLQSRVQPLILADISRGLFAGTIGVERLLKMFERAKITATWFIPGHSLETFPEQCAMIRGKFQTNALTLSVAESMLDIFEISSIRPSRIASTSFIQLFLAWY